MFTFDIRPVFKTPKSLNRGHVVLRHGQ